SARHSRLLGRSALRVSAHHGPAAGHIRCIEIGFAAVFTLCQVAVIGPAKTPAVQHAGVGI
ncbi:MAG: hypothetical protein ACK55I_45210, partial [bacterium]